jgi:hypothetical protein
VLLTFYDFPAERWKHLRTTNPIEATFVTVRHRTVRSKGCLAPRSLTPSPKIGDSFSVPSTGALWQKFTGDSANPATCTGGDHPIFTALASAFDAGISN